MNADPAVKIASLLHHLPDSDVITAETVDVRAVLDELGRYRYLDIAEPRELLRSLSRGKSQQLAEQQAERDAAVKTSQQVATHLGRVEAERDHLRSERDHYRECFKFTTEHMAAVHEELGLSYEAETEEVVAAIRKLRG